MGSENSKFEESIGYLQKWLHDEGGNHHEEIYDDIISEVEKLRFKLENDHQAPILDEAIAGSTAVLKRLQSSELRSLSIDDWELCGSNIGLNSKLITKDVNKRQIAVVCEDIGDSLTYFFSKKLEN